MTAHLDAGRVLQASVRCERARVLVESFAFAAQSEPTGADLDAFEKDAARFDAELREQEERYEAISPHGLADLARGLADSARVAARPFFESARLYARADSPAAGRFYVHHARAQLSCAAFCRQLNLRGEGPSTVPGDLAQRVDAFERELVGTFAAADAELRAGSPIALVNVGLKKVRDLLRADLPHGAWLELLRARLRLGLVQHREDAVPARGAIASQWQEWRARIEAADSDTSIARAFGERIESALAAPAAAAAAELRAAARILADLLPRCVRD